jgi:signal transduction histidine kinase
MQQIVSGPTVGEPGASVRADRPRDGRLSGFRDAVAGWPRGAAGHPAWDRSAAIFDVLMALSLTVFAQLNLRFNFDQSTHYGSSFAAAVATAVATTAVAFRRRAPLATACVVAVAIAGPELGSRLTITLWGDFVPLMIASYSVARYAQIRPALVGCAAIGLGLLVLFLRVPVIGTIGNIPFTLVPFTGAFVAGRVLRRHQEAGDRARRLESERDATVRAAIADERSRIARELHDIVAHCVSVMVVQAGAAEDLLIRDPAQARASLRSVQDSGRQAVVELQRMLGLLRGDGAALALKPQPGTDQLPDLVDHMNEVGLPVVLTIEGTPRRLPAGTELTVYRIAQEALTNTLKHAGIATARIMLRYTDHDIELEIVDNGHGGMSGSGHGLIGMRERAALYGGTLSVGKRPDGGFGVRMTLPTDGTGP